MIGIELFSGAGGMSMGAAMAGVNVKLAIDVDTNAIATYSHNHKKTKVLAKDIREVSDLPFKDSKKAKILFGGPPCQGFSRSNHRTRNKENPNNWLFEEFIRLIKEWRPDWVVIENVEGVLGTEKGFFIGQILNSLREIKYTPSYKVLNAMNYGVPQNRERLFIVASLHGIEFEFPLPTYNVPITVKDALYDLPTLSNGNKQYTLNYRRVKISNYAKSLRGDMKKCLNNEVSLNTEKVLERYKHIPPGGNWQNIPSNILDTYKDASRCHSGIYHRLDKDKPSVVIGNYRKNMLIHPWEDRGLSVREAARLQSFPDSFEFKGTLGHQQQQVGNAVPPKLAKEVFAKILKY